MARKPEYQRLLNSKRWKALRVQYLQQQPLCERCQADGRVTAAVDVHHVIPVESAKTVREMEALCFNEAPQQRLMALCPACHAAVHKEARSHSREEHQARAEARADAIINKYRRPVPARTDSKPADWQKEWRGRGKPKRSYSQLYLTRIFNAEIYAAMSEAEVRKAIIADVTERIKERVPATWTEGTTVFYHYGTIDHRYNLNRVGTAKLTKQHGRRVKLEELDWHPSENENPAAPI